MATEELTEYVPQPRLKKIPPRAESLLKHIIDSLITNAQRSGDDTAVDLPPLVERAYMVVNETAALSVLDYAPDDVFIKEQ